MNINVLAAYVSYSYSSNANPVMTLIVALVAAIIGLGVSALICWALSKDLEAVPPEYRRQMTPGQVWLLMIPLFNLVWNFFVFPRVADSFRAYFESTGRPIPGDYGRGMSIAYAILLPCSIVPCLGFLCAIAALVLLVLLLVKFAGYKKVALSGGGAAFPIDVLPPR